VALAQGWGVHYNPAARTKSGRGSARLERTVRVREVPSSNLGAPTSDISRRYINKPTTLQDQLEGCWFLGVDG
jgi:hypothetical protein